MSDTGFSKKQLDQLHDLFDENNRQTAEGMEHIVNSLSETIEEVKKRLLTRIDTVETNLRSEIYLVKSELKDDINNLALTMATKYEVENLNRRVSELEHHPHSQH